MNLKCDQKVQYITLWYQFHSTFYSKLEVLIGNLYYVK